MADALAAARRKERAIIENTSEVICSLDPLLRFTAVNPASLAAWGYEPAELIGKGISTILPEDELESSRAQFEKMRETESSMPLEIRIMRKDQGELEMSWSVQWSKEEECYFCVAHDITARKQIERMKREFIAMVSHDLRTPLTSIQGFLSLLDAGVYGQISDSGMESLEIADSSISRLIKLVNDLLDAERLESGKMELNLGTCSILHLFESSADAVETFADQQGVKLTVVAPSHEHDSVYADGDRLIQVLVNLLSNAIKFSASGTKVTLASIPVEDMIELQVIDEGRGIPAEFLDSVFERFKQVKKSDSKNRKGTGLGLAICKAIIEKHGGQIGVRSEEGKGSTFWFRIPEREPEVIKLEAEQLEQFPVN
jgi:PAS domain S-box-containing protein